MPRNEVVTDDYDGENGPKRDFPKVQVVVAQGRSVLVPYKIGERKEKNEKGDLEVVNSWRSKTHGPGEIIEVGENEVPWLRAHGYLEPATRNAPIQPAIPADGSPDPVPTINGRPGNKIAVGRDAE
jgi:hypothetical protein